MTTGETFQSKAAHLYLSESYTLPCGVAVKNRILKSAMIDRRALGEPNNVVVESEKDFELLQTLAKAGTQNIGIAAFINILLSSSSRTIYTRLRA